jgi:hypothetical protein
LTIDLRYAIILNEDREGAVNLLNSDTGESIAVAECTGFVSKRGEPGGSGQVVLK